ncbi:glutathione binding-like protein [Croceicoccus sediminis]|uniref:glutathione binding-like protein n=1 Tax=Croceicoccus sediminis TaxID=2571150 RepID=UPI001182B6BD|nr:glutathione binding-like protein [Croceicoccus sediminis]
MIDLYYWPTPNGHKITMMLEECGLAYNLMELDLSSGKQRSAEFLAISPNGRMPAIVDHAPSAGEGPLTVFESGAILVYLAEKAGKFLSDDARQRFEALQWLFWQMGGVGPMVGQNAYFSLYAPEKIPHAIHRYRAETDRLYGVLEGHLRTRTYVAGDDYSIADMAIYPWVACHDYIHADIDHLTHLSRWMEQVVARPATIRAYEIAEKVNPDFRTPPVMTDELRKVLFER